MRKNTIMAMIIGAALVGSTLSLSACSNDDKDKETTVTSESVTTKAETTEATTEETMDTQTETEAETETETETEIETVTEEETEAATEETTEKATEASKYSGMSMKDLAAELIATGGYESLYEYPSDDLMDYYGLDVSLTDDYAFYVAENSPIADTIALFECKSREATDDIAQKLETYLEGISESTKDYAPEEYDKTTKTGVSTFGNFVVLVITGDQNSSQAVLNEYIAANCE